MFYKMKRLFLTGIAALLLATTGAAHAGDRFSTTLPPEKYDVPYTGLLKIWITPLPVIEYFCRGVSHISCAWPLSGGKECRILILQPVAEGKRFDTLNFDGKAAVNVKGNLALTLRHELGHCNGWPNDHPDGRTTSYEESVTMPKLPTTTQVVCTNSDRIYIDCKIAKPWWPQESAATAPRPSPTQESAVTAPRPSPAQAGNAQTPEEYCTAHFKGYYLDSCMREAMEQRSGVKKQLWDCGEGLYIPVVRDIPYPKLVEIKH